MKKFTKALALLMALAMVFALAACSGGGDTGESSNNNASEAPKSTFAPVAKGQIKVGVIHIGNPKDTSGYTHAHDQGIVDMQKTLGLQDNQIIRKNNIDDQDKKAIETAIREYHLWHKLRLYGYNGAARCGVSGGHLLPLLRLQE